MKRIVCKLARDLKVWSLAEGGALLQRAMRTKVPDEFFHLTVDEVR